MNDLLTYDFFAQAVGVLASAIVVFSFSRKHDDHLKFFIIFGNILFAAHFFMLDAYAGMLINMINAFRVGFSIKFHKSNWMMWFFLGVYLIAGYVVYEEPKDLLPVLSSLLGTYSMFKLSGIKLRLVGMIGASSWLTYAIISHSIGGMITEIGIMLSNSATIIRLMKDKKHKAI